MGGVVKFFKRGTDTILKKAGLGAPFGTVRDAQTPVDQLPGPPDATQTARDTTDRIRKRKGVLANIFAGNGAGSANVGKKTLGG